MSAMKGTCQRCGRQVEVAQPVDGERDPDLDQVKATFRFCSRCRRYVGRGCCWASELVTCLDCAPMEAAAPADDLEPARWALDELRVSTRGLESVAIGLDAAGETESQVAWEDAWWGVAWLATRAESSRDAVSRRLWHAPGMTEGAPQMVADLAKLLAAYERAHRKTVERLRGPLRAERTLRQRTSSAP